MKSKVPSKKPWKRYARGRVAVQQNNNTKRKRNWTSGLNGDTRYSIALWAPDWMNKSAVIPFRSEELHECLNIVKSLGCVGDSPVDHLLASGLWTIWRSGTQSPVFRAPKDCDESSVIIPVFGPSLSCLSCIDSIDSNCMHMWNDINAHGGCRRFSSNVGGFLCLSITTYLVLST